MIKQNFKAVFYNLSLYFVGLCALILNYFYHLRNITPLFAAKAQGKDGDYFEVYYQDDSINFGVWLEDTLIADYISLFAIIGNKHNTPFTVSREIFQLQPKSRKKEIFKPVSLDELPACRYYSLINCELLPEMKVSGMVHFRKKLPLSETVFSFKLDERIFRVYFPKTQANLN